MYSPKIDEKLIPFLYQVAQNRKMPMTQLVNEIIDYGLRRIDEVKETAGPVCPMSYHAAQMETISDIPYKARAEEIISG